MSSEYGNYNPVHAGEYDRERMRRPDHSMIWFALVALFAEALFFAIYVSRLEDRIAQLERNQTVFDNNIKKLAARPQTIIHRNEYVPVAPAVFENSTQATQQKKKDCWVRDGNSYRECTPVN